MKISQRWYRRHQLFNPSLPPVLASWLFDTSSLTARMLKLCGNDFSVRVISQKWQKLKAEETTAMALVHEHSALVRQVLLCCGDKPFIYARTVIPATTLHGAQRRYANMGSRPLGAMLFADRTMRREAVEVGILPADCAAVQYSASDEPIWGRRSVFRVSNKPLLVAEYFLPALIEHKLSARELFNHE